MAAQSRQSASVEHGAPRGEAENASVNTKNEEPKGHVADGEQQTVREQAPVASTDTSISVPQGSASLVSLEQSSEEGDGQSTRTGLSKASATRDGSSAASQEQSVITQAMCGSNDDSGRARSRDRSPPSRRSQSRSRSPLPVIRNRPALSQPRNQSCQPAPNGATRSTNYSDIWIIAGDDALHPSFHEVLEASCAEYNWSLDKLKLPGKVVVHTGVAVAQVLFYLDYTGVLGASTRLHCAVSECCLKQWPARQQAAHVSRIDNINHVYRSFGVDGGSTRLMEKREARPHAGEALLRSDLRYFYILGDGPVGRIDVHQYKKDVIRQGKRALTDETLVAQLVKAHGKSSRNVTNGVTLMNRKGGEVSWLMCEICEQSGTGSNVLLLVLDPAGRSVSFS